MSNETVEIQPVGPLRATIRPPGSKSITNRALVCAALADESSTLTGALDSEDTAVMIQSLRHLSVPIEAAEDALLVHGCGGRIPAASAALHVANSGTTMRFLAAMATLGHGEFRIDGIARMRERPIQDLLDALTQLGADATSELRTGCPPVLVRANGLAGGECTIRGDASSQFLSGLLMVAPYAQRPVDVVVSGPLVSQPYIEMTRQVMRAFGARVETDDMARFHVPAARYQGRTYAIEPDASAASYFFAAAAITGGEITVLGLSQDSLQGDVRFCECLRAMGCQVRYGEDEITVVGAPLQGITVDMNDISDTAQTLAAVALFASGPTTIEGVGHNRLKETDRIADLATELRKLGARVQERDDSLTIEPGEVGPASIETYNDHRMAMSMALVGLRTAGIVIQDPSCAKKTYPKFFEDLRSLNRG